VALRDRAARAGLEVSLKGDRARFTRELHSRHQAGRGLEERRETNCHGVSTRRETAEKVGQVGKAGRERTLKEGCPLANGGGARERDHRGQVEADCGPDCRHRVSKCREHHGRGDDIHSEKHQPHASP